MDRVKTMKTILWSLVGLAASVGFTRFIFGLGATTNLSDHTPWGLWIGFDVVSGVALAAGGFVITFTVYVLRREEFHPIVRPAVLTAFLGYIAVIVGLLFDLGAPWNIWRPMAHWQHHSALFEVAWCVILYTTVLALEFSPIPLEETSRCAKIRSFLLRYRLPLVMLGIMLSTLHQSSLGSLFLIMPYRLHALWHTPILPVLFFISAVGLGLMMVTLESLFTGYLYRRKPETRLLSKLGGAAAVVLGLYFAVRMADIIDGGKLPVIFEGSGESRLFIIEILLSSLIPAILLAFPRVRSSLGGLWTAALMVVSGFALNRIDTSGVAMLGMEGGYFPAWTEFAVSLGVVSAAILAFMFAVERFNIWESKPRDAEDFLHAQPHFDRASESWLGEPGYSGRVKYSLAFILAAAAGFALIPGQKLYSEGFDMRKAVEARGVNMMVIDGNRDHRGVNFAHQTHIEDMGGTESCSRCHHMNLPMDETSACSDCHRLMYQPCDAFQHDWHCSPTGANISCHRCHLEGTEKSSKNTVGCEDCHRDLIPANASIAVSGYLAPSYVDAMHGLCVKCHYAKADSVNKPCLGRCGTCHTGDLTTEGLSLEGLDYQPWHNWLNLPQCMAEQDTAGGSIGN